MHEENWQARVLKWENNEMAWEISSFAERRTSNVTFLLLFRLVRVCSKIASMLVQGFEK
jgi:hypothetical protein